MKRQVSDAALFNLEAVLRTWYFRPYYQKIACVVQLVRLIDSSGWAAFTSIANPHLYLKWTK